MNIECRLLSLHYLTSNYALNHKTFTYIILFVFLLVFEDGALILVLQMRT